MQVNKEQNDFKSKAVWDTQFKEGKWEILGSESKMGHYLAIVGCIAGLKKNPKILDAGCGQGILLKYLDGPNYGSYIGIDFSKEAIRQANNYKDEKTKFVVSKIEDWKSNETFDIMIFNESIYYLENPRKILLQYSKYLKNDGFFIISICRYKNNYNIWNEIADLFQIKTQFRVYGNEDMEWDIRIFRKKKY